MTSDKESKQEVGVALVEEGEKEYGIVMSNKSAFFVYGSGFTEEERDRLITFTLKEKGRFNKLLENYSLHTLLEHKLSKEQGVKVAKFVVENEEIFDHFVTDYRDFSKLMRLLPGKEQIKKVALILEDKTRFDRLIFNTRGLRCVLDTKLISDVETAIIDFVISDEGRFDQLITDNRELLSILGVLSEKLQAKVMEFVFSDDERFKRLFKNDADVLFFCEGHPKFASQVKQKFQSLTVSPPDDKKREVESGSSGGDQHIDSISTSPTGGPAAPLSGLWSSSQSTDRLPSQSNAQHQQAVDGSLDRASSSTTTQKPDAGAPSDSSGSEPAAGKSS
jgi:hypothetical protein